MARRPSVRYFASRGAFYCQFNGRQYRLAEGPDDAPTGPTYLAALGQFKHLLQKGNVERAGATNTVRVVLEAYMEQKQHRLKGSTVTSKLFRLKPFADQLGEVRVGDLTHFRVNQFVQKMRQARTVGRYTHRWGESTAATFFNDINAVFNWAVRAKLIPANPLAGLDSMDRPHARSRSRDCLVSAEQHAKVLAECRAESMRQFIVALENTGARPGELVNATAKDWDDALGAIVYYGDDRRRQDEFRHKTARHKDRVIYFTGAALEMMRALVKAHPGGRLFRSSRGGAYGDKSIASCFRALRDRLGMPKLTAYSYRHSFATNWLLAGRSIEVLAELLGNTPATIRKHYEHLCSDRQAIRRHVEEFRAAGRT